MALATKLKNTNVFVKFLVILLSVVLMASQSDGMRQSAQRQVSSHHPRASKRSGTASSSPRERGSFSMTLSPLSMTPTSSSMI